MTFLFSHRNGLAVVFALLALGAQAQNWPDKPIKLGLCRNKRNG